MNTPTNVINSEDLMALGYTPGRAFGVALRTAGKHQRLGKETLLAQLADVLAAPEAYAAHAVYGKLANALIEAAAMADIAPIPLREAGTGYAVYGESHIEPGARAQMDVAMQLPVAVAGALMPDAHQGYGLPIGGVLAVDNAVIPYGVGVDIGCRMALSIYDIPETFFVEHHARFKRELIAQTRFGAGHGFKPHERADHQVLTDEAFGMNPFVANLKDKAWAQLGTSGGGNHFVEFGIIEFPAADEPLGIPAGKYLALLSHSGSRGLGATIAGHYTKLAKELCHLPSEARNLAYLGLDTHAGQEYWQAMTLAGSYASASHDIIHRKMAAALGAEVLARVENHHNFAWKETWNGQEVVVHRKGATPAGKGVLGIIPGSMTAPGFLVRGKGEAASISSASHGAGRQMSRTQAIKTISRDAMKATLKQHGVTLIGAGLDEAPMAYKDIHTVMAAQTALVEVVATFTPRLVRMADDGSRED
ncbi:tRNA-splicing ligase RtcB [Parapedobacter composti]|uniref:3'-phosphate/5'-hydroxy nucleic acid ligase n=1 Tax=Parapedobacter composti TaxID=623281 RepID=A0A1I1H655_9SPHI|nr:RtcB family protein [Parapedobacter composti]SFC19195.1 tRNA-splicing ligase RtcB [Parapedobacter composti]